MNISENLIEVGVEINAMIRLAASNNNLTLSQTYHLLSIPFEGIQMSNLAKKLALDTSTITRNINKLEKKNLVSKNKNNRDKRSQLIQITNNGLDIISSIEIDLNNYIYHTLKIIDVDTQQSLYTIIEKLAWALACKRN